MFWSLKRKKVGRSGSESEYELQDVEDSIDASLGKRLSKFIKEFSINRSILKIRTLEVLPIGDHYILPNSRRYLVWWMFTVIAATYSSMFTPLEFGFYRGLPSPLWIADLSIQSIFIADILVRFFVAYRDPETYKLVVDHRSIAKRYAKSELLFDVLGCLPWDTIYKGSGRREIIRYFLWIRLYRVRKVNEFFEKMEKDIRINYFGIRIVKLLAVEFYCTHTAACIFYYLATTLPESKEEYTWIGSLQLGAYSYENFRAIDIGKRYVTSLYWAILTMATVAEFLNEIVSKVIEEHFLPGEVVIHQGGASDQFYIIAHGVLEEILVAEDGTEDVVSRLKAEGICGEVGVLCNIPQPFTVRVSALCRLLRIDKNSFTHIVQIYFNDGRTLINNLLEWKDTDARFGQLAADITFMVAKQQAELALMVNNAAFQGDISQLKHLVKAGAVTAKGDYDGRTPLHLAASKGYDAVVQFLIREGVDVNSIDKFGCSPLLEAVKGGHDHTIAILVEHGAQLHLKDAGSFLCQTAMSGNSELLRRLIEARVSLSASDYDRRTALHLAAAEGSFPITKMLLDAGADAFARDRWGRTPLDEAVLHNRTNVLHLLKDAAVVDFKTSSAEAKSTLRARRPATAVKDSSETGDRECKGLEERSTDTKAFVSPLLSQSAESSLSVKHRPCAEKRLERLITLGVAGPRRSSSVSDQNVDLCTMYRMLPVRQAGSTEQVYDPSYFSRFNPLPRRRCTIFPYHPWTPRVSRTLGKVEWVCQTIEEILDIAFHEYGKQGTKLLNQDCGELSSTDLIGDMDKVYVVDDEDIRNAGSTRHVRKQSDSEFESAIVSDI